MDFIDFLPIFSETEEAIRARMDADVDTYRGPGDPVIDKSEGNFYFLNTQPSVMAFARLYDDISVGMAAAFIPYAWGDYLDYHGQQLQTPRKAAVRANGTVNFTGTNGTLIAAGTLLTPTQTDPSVAVPTFQTTATVMIASGVANGVPIEALDEGVNGNVAAHAIDVLRTANPGISGVDNPNPTLDGTDIEDDQDFMPRLLLAAQGTGPGVITDYIRWGLAAAGVGRVTVQPAWNGPNSVMVTLMAKDGSPVSTTIINERQAYLDPDPGMARGAAPVGAVVTVNTPTIVTVAVTASHTFETGYSLDGGSGTTALRAAITAAIQDYINGLDVGDDVVAAHVKAQFFKIKGVHDVTMTAPSGNVSINGATNPPQVARTGVVTLT